MKETTLLVRQLPKFSLAKKISLLKSKESGGVEKQKRPSQHVRAYNCDPTRTRTQATQILPIFTQNRPQNRLIGEFRHFHFFQKF